jgi:hypothetical protein
MGWDKSSITQEILFRAFEDAGIGNVWVGHYHERAWSHFKSCVHALLNNPEANINETDFGSLVEVISLKVSYNCLLPDMEIKEGYSPIDPPIMLIMGGWHIPTNNISCVGVNIVSSALDWNLKINNPLAENNDIMHVFRSGKHLCVYPFRDNCFIKYIKEYDSLDDELSNDTFSDKFVYGALEMAVIGFKNEVTAQEFQ